jgi:putative oxidoreductase
MGVVRDLFAFVGRLGLGVVLIAHGLQKFFEWGIAGTEDSFREMAIPAPQIAAWYAALVELVGGAALILGVALPLFGILIAIEMAGAVLFVHLPYGMFSPQGYELPLVAGTAALALGFNGGRWAIDHALFGRPRRTPEHARTTSEE